jgi:hypothetical protein
MKHKAVVGISFRIVVEGEDGVSHAIDNFLTRALQSDIPKELYTEGLISADMIGTAHIFHQWEE